MDNQAQTHDVSADDGRRFLLGLAGLGGVAALAGMAKGGPLDPPAGSVIGTGKTLSEVYDRVETRPDGVPINATNTPGGGSNSAVYRITQPGRYYFPAGTGTIDATTVAGVLDIKASGVEVDLNGRTLVSFAAAQAAVIRVGVSGQGAVGNIRVHNGSVVRGDADSQFVAGIDIDNGTTGGLVVEDVRFIGCGMRDTHQSPVNGVRVRGCVFVDVGGEAVYLSPGSVGTRLEDCFVAGAANGFVLGDSARVERCVLENTAAGSRPIGIMVGSSSVVRDCQLAGYGSASLNWGGIAASDGCLIERNVVRRALLGVRAGFGCTITDNVLEGIGAGTGTGVLLGAMNNRVMRNHISLFGAGVAGTVGSQIVIQNTFAQVGSGITVNATNSLIGTFINAGNMATQANPYANMYV